MKPKFEAIGYFRLDDPALPIRPTVRLKELAGLYDASILVTAYDEAGDRVLKARTALVGCLALVMAGRYDLIIVTGISAVARTAFELKDFLSFVRDRSIRVVFLNEAIDTSMDDGKSFATSYLLAMSAL